MTPAPAAAIIRGMVWHDVCDAQASEGCVTVEGSEVGDGERTGDEPGIQGVEVWLGSGACPSSGTKSAVTAADGSYAFVGYEPGTYCVSIDSESTTNLDHLHPGGWTNPSNGEAMITVEVVGGEDFSEVDFGWDYATIALEPKPPLVTAVADASCRIGPGTMYDVVAFLLEGDSAEARGRNDDGTWLRVQLPELIEACWVSNLSVNANFSPEELTPQEIPPTPTPVSGAIVGIVWHDECSLIGEIPTPGCVATASDEYLGNGIREDSEPGLGGVLINLGEGTCPSHGLASSISDDEGSYRFIGLPAGAYCVSIDTRGAVNSTILVPGEWTQPPGDAQASFAIILAPGEEYVGADFGWDYQFLP